MSKYGIEHQRAQACSSVGVCGARNALRRSLPEFPRCRCPSLRWRRIASSAGMARISSNCRFDRRDIGVRQIDLVDDRDDREALLVREMNVRDRLRLHALRGVDDQHRAFAGRSGCAKLRRKNRRDPAYRADSAVGFARLALCIAS